MSKRIITVVLAMVMLLTNVIGIMGVSAEDASYVEHSYSPVDYCNVVKTADEGIWSVYHRDNLNYDTSTWISVPLSTEANKMIRTDGTRWKDLIGHELGYDYYEDTGARVVFPVFLPDSTFVWQPWLPGETVNGGAFGWTAPYTGEWVVKVKAYQRSFQALHQVLDSSYEIATKAASETMVTPVHTEAMLPSNLSSETDVHVYETEKVLTVNEGDSVYLLANGEMDNFVHFQYIITDKNNPTVMYDASKISNYHMTDANGVPSPFTFGRAKDTKNIAADQPTSVDVYNIQGLPHTAAFVAGWTNMFPLDLYTNNNGDGWVWTGDAGAFNANWPVLAMPEGGYVLITPRNDKGGYCESPVMMFTAPEDGNYIFDISATFQAPGDTTFYLYRTGGPRAAGEDWFVGGGHFDEANYSKEFKGTDASFDWEKTLFDMKKGETVMLVPISKYTGGIVIQLNEFNVNKIKDVGYAYSVNGAPAASFADVSAAAGTGTLSLTCTLWDKETVASDTATLLLAIYDDKGCMKAADISEVATLTKNNGFVELTASFAIPSGVAGGKVKAYLFDNCENIRPLFVQNEF